MKRGHLLMGRILKWIGFVALVFPILVPQLSRSQDPRSKGLTKEEYYNSVLAPQYGLKPLHKVSSQVDRKLSTLNVGNVWAKISNAATLGYDRWGVCWEFPARSGITYRWTMAPMIAALKKDSGGNIQKRVAVGTRGAFRKSEEEFQPLPGYDAGIGSYDEKANVGIAFSDVKASWPDHWPGLSELPPYARRVPYELPKVDSSFGFPGVKDGVVAATREAFFSVTDNVPGEGNVPLPLDVRVDTWALQYDDLLNRNFIIFRLKFTNVGTDTLKDVYIGIHDDPDCPEQGAQEWTDDFAAFIKPGTTGVPGYSPKEDTLLWNFTYLWDGDDKAEGFIAKNVGWVGLKFLETPINPVSGKSIGVTTFQVFEYSSVAQGDENEYDQMAAGIMAPPNPSPHSRDYTQTPNSYGPDVTYVVASGPFTLAPGKSLPFAFASIHGTNKKDLFNSAILCQLLYNANFNSAEPPPEPVVTAVGGNKKVTLYWDDVAESGRYRRSDGTLDHLNDRLTRTNAFEGYKIYRSTDQGITWGNPIIDFQGVNKGIIPLAQFDLKNDTTGESQHPLGRYFYLGEDTGLRHMYVDNNVNNGYEYWYAVAAYDHDDGPIPPLENSIKSDPYKPNDNTVAVTPQAPPVAKTIGAVPANSAVRTSGRASVPFVPISVLNPDIVPGDSFAISFNVTSATKKTFSVKNSRTGKYAVSISGDTVRDRSFYNSLMDNAPIFNGVAVYVRDTVAGIAKTLQVAPANSTRLIWKSGGIENVESKGAEDDYTIEFTSEQYWAALAGGGNNHKQTFKVPFKVMNQSRNVQVVAVLDEAPGGTVKKYDIQKGDKIIILDVQYKAGLTAVDSTVTIDTSAAFTTRGVKALTTNYSIRVLFDTVSQYQVGDVYSIETIKTFSNSDTYKFATVAATERTITEADLSGITVVPNPFVVSSPYETGKYGAQKLMQFQRLPNRCTIRIFNIAGDLVRTIEHNGGSIETWNLQTYNQQEVAFGVYIFHVEAPGIGSSIGKFAVIK